MSVLGPILFIMYIDALEIELEFSISKFPDDVSIDGGVIAGDMICIFIRYSCI